MSILYAMSVWTGIKWAFIGAFGRVVLWLWITSTRRIVVGADAYRALRRDGKPVILLVWHGRIFMVPFFFRNQGIAPLISPSRDGEIVARIMAGWGFRILRGSGSHSMVASWKEMVRELRNGGEVIIVPDGPRGPDRKLKLGGLKLAVETGARMVPFTFSTSRKKHLHSWDHFLLFPPFSKVVLMFGPPVELEPGMTSEELEKAGRRIEQELIALDNRADKYFG